jgi:CheY-like chemotaxis protein
MEASARELVESLRASAGSFGFAGVTRAAGLVVNAEREAFHSRLLGLLDVLDDVIEGGNGGGSIPHGWLLHAAAPFPEGTSVAQAELGAQRDTRAAWRRAGAILGVGQDALAERIAKRLGLAVADLDDPRPAAARLVPLSLIEAGPVLPLREDGLRMVAATANPTDLRLIAALERITTRRAVLEVAPPEAIERALLLHLPEAGSTAPELPPVPRPREGAIVALVADDEPAYRLLVRSLLEREGFEVIEAADGAEALELMERLPRVDLLVVDLRMPLLDGRDVVRRVREAGSDTSILVLTGAQEIETEAELIEGGADDYVRKPVEPRILLARVLSVLRRRGR